MSVLTEVIEQMQQDFKALKARVDKIEPREIDSASKKNILDGLDFVTDNGTAEPSAGILDVFGGDGIATSGAGNDVTIGVTEGNVCTTDRRFHLGFDGHSWPDLMEPGWEPTETNVIFLGWEHMCGVLRKDSEGQYRATFDKAVQIAGAATNYIINSSFETNTNNWQIVIGGDTLTRTADDYVYGDYCMACGLSAGLSGIYTNPSMVVAAANTYTASIWVKAPAGQAMQLWLDERSAADVRIGIVTSVAFTGTGYWQYVTATRTFGALGVRARVYIINPVGSGAVTIWTDAVDLTQTAYPTPHIDGSLGAGHSFTGAAHASTSTRAAATLTYPNDVVAYPSGDCYEQLTIAGWFIPAWANTTTGDKFALDVRGAGANSILLTYNATTDAWQMYINGATRIVGSAQTFNSWEPQFVVWTFDFDADKYQLYVNDDAAVEDATVLTPPLLTGDVYIGSTVVASAQFDGLIDDFVIYPRVLSATEIEAIYKFGNPLLPPTHANMRVIFGEWTSTTFAGGGFTTVGWTTLDLVNDCGIPFGAKAVSVFALTRDSGTAGQTFQLRKDATHSPSLHAWTNAGGNMWINTNAIVPVANGRTIDYQISASGALTQDVYLRIYAIYL